MEAAIWPANQTLRYIVHHRPTAHSSPYLGLTSPARRAPLLRLRLRLWLYSETRAHRGRARMSLTFWGKVKRVFLEHASGRRFESHILQHQRNNGSAVGIHVESVRRGEKCERRREQQTHPARPRRLHPRLPARQLLRLPVCAKARAPPRCCQLIEGVTVTKYARMCCQSNTTATLTSPTLSPSTSTWRIA